MRTRSRLWVLLLAAWPAVAGAQDWRTLSRGREYSGEKALTVDLEYGAGRLGIQPAAQGVLYRASIRYDADVFEPELEFGGSALHIGIGNGEMHGHKNMKGGSLDLRLGPQAPLDLNLKFGATEANLELGGLRVRNLKVSTGASGTTLRISKPNLAECQQAEIEVGAARLEAIGLGNLNARQLEVSGGMGEVVLDFTGAWRGDLNAQVHMGLGSLTLRVPKGLGVSVRKDGILSGFDSQGLTKRGNTYYSDGFERAQRKLAVQLEAACGAIRVVWVD
ncbi:MAG: hypothetical protein FIB01_10415 [Gemmatimonadetes bacterium]|nr:hypothetical protein [Gemmatimonadota bacterium]